MSLEEAARRLSLEIATDSTNQISNLERAVRELQIFAIRLGAAIDELAAKQ